MEVRNVALGLALTGAIAAPQAPQMIDQAMAYEGPTATAADVNVEDQVPTSEDAFEQQVEQYCEDTMATPATTRVKIVGRGAVKARLSGMFNDVTDATLDADKSKVEANCEERGIQRLAGKVSIGAVRNGKFHRISDTVTVTGTKGQNFNEKVDLKACTPAEKKAGEREYTTRQVMTFKNAEGEVKTATVISKKSKHQKC